MNNEELKNKIAKFICNACEMGSGFDGECDIGNDYHKCSICGETADALISAGLKFDVLNENEYQKYCAYKTIDPQIKGCFDREKELEKRVEEAEHRAVVAERMAKNACSIVFTREIDDKDWAEVICQYKEEHGLFDEVGITDDMLYDYLKEQAEKELAEERK